MKELLWKSYCNAQLYNIYRRKIKFAMKGVVDKISYIIKGTINVGEAVRFNMKTTVPRKVVGIV